MAKENWKNEDKWTEKAEIRQPKFLANNLKLGYILIYSGLKTESLVTLRSQQKGTLTSASTVPHREVIPTKSFPHPHTVVSTKLCPQSHCHEDVSTESSPQSHRQQSILKEKNWL